MIRVRFIASPGFVGWAIRRVTNSLFQHVEFGTPEGTWIGAHAGAGIQERPGDYCKPSLEYVYEIDASELNSNQLLIRARSLVGTKYNYLDIFGLWIKNRTLTSPGRLMCAQFVTGCLLYALGASKVLNVLPEFAYLITPETLHLSPLFVGRRVKAYDAQQSPCQRD